MKTGVIIARFQVPYLHEGHIHLIREVEKKSDNIVFLLGSPTVPDIRNPLPYDHRADMIFEHLWFDPSVFVHELPNHDDDIEWSKQIDSILDHHEGVTLYGSRDSFRKHYHGKYPFEEIPEIPSISGTELRKTYGIESLEDYRAGYIAGVSQMLENQQHEKEKQEGKPTEK